MTMMSPGELLQWWRRHPTMRAALVGALMPLGVRSRSEPHASDLSPEQDDLGQPVIVLGTPRGGTTTVQGRIARALGRRSIFEPFGVNHLDLRTFGDANRLFRMGGSTLDLHSEESLAFTPHCFDLVGEAGRGVGNALRAHVAALHTASGPGVVWKEIRLLYALPGLLQVYKDLGLEPTVVLVRCDPRAVLYSFYRMVVLGRRGAPFRRNLDGFFENRLRLFEARWGTPDFLSQEPEGPSQRVVAGALLDLEAMRRFEVEFGAQVRSTDLSALDETLCALGARPRLAGLGHASETGTSARAPAWSRDPLFCRTLENRLGPSLAQSLRIRSPASHSEPGVPTSRQMVTFLLNSIC
jgi:hypothetical protein